MFDRHAMKASSVPAAEIDGAAAYEMPGVRFNMSPVARPAESIGRLQTFIPPTRLEKNMRVNPVPASLTEACKSCDVVKLRRVGGPATFPASEMGSSQRFVVSPRMAANNMRCWPPSHVMGVIQSSPKGGLRSCS